MISALGSTIGAVTFLRLPRAEEAAPPDVSQGIPDIEDWLPEPVLPYWELVAAYPIIASAVIAVVAFVAAYIVRGVVVRGALRLASRTDSDLDNRAISLFRRPIFTTVFYVGLAIAIRAARVPESLASLESGAVKVLLSLVVLHWLVALLPFLRLLLEALGRNAHRFTIVEERTVPLLDIITKLVVLLVGSYVLLMIWGINPVGWLASAGVVGIAVGFAAKDTLANLFSGFFILADSPYKVGDYVNLDTGDRGKVISIGMRSTRLLTRDDVEITVPNAVIANAKIVNESGGPWTKMRLRVAVGVAYGSDVDHVCATLQRIGDTHKDVCRDPKPRVRLRGFGDSSLDFQLLCWIDEPELRGRVYHELYMTVYKTFAEEGIEIPFPQRDVWLRQGGDEPAATD